MVLPFYKSQTPPRKREEKNNKNNNISLYLLKVLVCKNKCKTNMINKIMKKKQIKSATFDCGKTIVRQC